MRTFEKTCKPSVRLAYTRYDSKQLATINAPVIFLHALNFMKENWGDLPETIANLSGRVVYAVDHRNHGDSEWSDEWDFDVNADDVLSFMDEQGVGKAVLVGHSMGGVAAYKVALRAPERVEKLFIEDISTKPVQELILQKCVQYLELMRALAAKIPPNSTKKEAANHVLKNIRDKLPSDLKNNISLETYAQLFRRENGVCTLKSNLDVMIRVLKEPSKLYKGFDGLYQGPVTVLCGGKSHGRNFEDGDLIRRNFPAAEVVTIEEASHTVHEDCPVEFQRLLLQFLHE